SVKNSIESAERARDVWRGTLAASYGTARFEYPGGHGVAFIDGVVDSAQLPLEAPRAIILDATDLDDLDRAIDRMFQHWTGRESAGPGPAGVQAAVDLLAKSWQVKTPLALDLKREAEGTRTPTDGQCRLTNMLPMQTRALIRGCAGSGKTCLAAETARRLANNGIPTLLTCFNKTLAGWLRERLSPRP